MNHDIYAEIEHTARLMLVVGWTFHPWAVVSDYGNGAGFGRYATLAEAIERRDSLIAGDGNGTQQRFHIALVLP